MPKINQSYAKDIPNIPKYAKGMPKIYQRYAKDILKICQRLAEYMPQKSLKICQR